MDMRVCEEAIKLTQKRYALGILRNEKHFLSVCYSLDILMGSSGNRYTTRVLMNDRKRNWYPVFVALVLRESRLEIDELDLVLSEAVSRGIKDISADKIFSFCLGCCRKMSFEPRWHMRKREDTRPLLNVEGKDLWRHLNRLYTDPEYSRIRPPDYVPRIGRMYNRYQECCHAARAMGQAELKRIYGGDVDLTLVTDSREQKSEVPSSFMSALRSGDIGESLLR